ncbi:MAG: LacI family DNA-binding transcriptional regulator [Sphaerochaetaceae bacterium]|nr:LacI family DNA-binding transcriptional regulator [Sphaerochaetaceae bacterium]MDC7238431.1 LacI family DNA-binding transcriptional regulator [Sphaerochaetaceae bacterium]MDC7250990.1 LacI family DNA-binding transcriptional regulator [Sphaerochaetaceae bacterium]
MSDNITIKDIAKLAKVSYSTVSRSLNDSPLVSEITKNKVIKIAKDLNFEFNANARGLILSKSNAIALVLSNKFSYLDTNSYQGLLLKSYLDIIDKKGFDLILLKQQDFINTNNIVIQHIKSKKIDGLIFLVENPNKETLSIINKLKFPVIFVHYPPTPELKNFNIIYSDYYKGGRLLADHLLKKNHIKFTILCNDKYNEEYYLREKGFCDEIKRHGGIINKLSCELNFFSAVECCEENIESITKTTALFGINDQIALAAMKVLSEHEIKIPNDIAIVGYDNSELSMYSSPSLTTINLNRDQMVQSCIENLIIQIKNANKKVIPNEIIILDPLLMERASS